MQDPSFWNNPHVAQSLAKELDWLRTFVSDWEKLVKAIQELAGLAEVAKEEAEGHPPTEDASLGKATLEADLKVKFELLRRQFEQIRLTTFLSEKYDQNAAILSIHAGAGGVDAQDWASMLLRMYLRYAKNKNFKTQILDESRGGEAGIKSVVLEITGPYAYGYLKSEAGVHRLVRLSPFNPAHTRETSFALVEVLPILEQREFKLKPEDIEIEAKTSRGPGGQSVNTTYSAIRATHKPSGIVVTIQTERSQAQNKEQALKILTAKVAKLEEERQQKEKLKIRGEFHSAEWGNQIRSYVLHPYKLVKDHRTNYETSDAEAVLEGNLDEFVKNYLEYAKMKE